MNTNIGPERVEVIPQPIGVIPVPGAATAVTAFIIRSTKEGAITDAPVSFLDLESFVEAFGDDLDMGNAYFAIQGFYENAGIGNKVIIVNIAPTASGSDVADYGLADAAGAGFVDEEGELLTGLAISTYAAVTGLVTFTGTPDLSAVKEGMYLKDDNGRLFEILSINAGAYQVEIAKNLVQHASQDVHAEGGINIGSTAAKILQIYEADMHNGKALVQAGAIKGAVTVTGVAGNIVSASAGGFLNMGAKVGDLLVDSGSAVFYITAVLDDNKVEVDRDGVAAGAANVYAAVVALISDTKRVAGTNASVSPQNTDEFIAAGAGYGTLPTSVGPYVWGALNNHFCIINGQEKEIAESQIIASGTVNGTFGSGPTLTYTSATGLVQFSAAVDLSTVAPGDVWRDASNNDFVIIAVNDGADNITILPGQTVNTAANSSIRDGQVKILFVDEEFNPGLVSIPEFFEPAARFEFAATIVGDTAEYFIADAMAQDSDYIGTAANAKGLHALDDQDDVSLICIPEVTSKVVQNALIDYTKTFREDAFSLLTIPKNINSPVVDVTKVTVSVSSVVNGLVSSTVQLSGSPNLNSVAAGDILVFDDAKYLILDVDLDDYRLTVESTSIAGSGSATIVAPSAITYKEIILNNPSKRAAWYFNHVKVLRSSDSAVLTVDPVGHVAGMMARIDANIAIGGVSKAPADIVYASLAGTVGLDLAISEAKHGEGLRKNFINRITEFPGTGRIVFGAYTADSGTSPAFTAEDQLIQVIRSVLFLKKSLEPGLRSFIWQNFSPETQLRAENAIKSFLRNNSYLFPAGLPEAQQFKVISVTATNEAIAKGLMKFKVQVRFNTAVRFVEIALQYPLQQIQG